MRWSPLQDFGIKYNAENGGPALEGLTDKIYNNTKSITAYLIADGITEVCESFYLVLCKKIILLLSITATTICIWGTAACGLWSLPFWTTSFVS